MDPSSPLQQRPLQGRRPSSIIYSNSDNNNKNNEEIAHASHRRLPASTPTQPRQSNDFSVPAVLRQPAISHRREMPRGGNVNRPSSSSSSSTSSSSSDGDDDDHPWACKAWARRFEENEELQPLNDPATDSHAALRVTNGRKQLVFRRIFPPHHHARSSKVNEKVGLGGCHPNLIKPISSTIYLDRSVRYDEEFVIGKDLRSYIQLFDECYKFTAEGSSTVNWVGFKMYQVLFCKSVARQLLEYCSWLHEVIKTPHRNIGPNTVLIQDDGLVKVKLFDFITESMVRYNPLLYTRTCAYVAPELRGCDPKLRVTSDYANDIWAVGAVLYAIMKGETMLPSIVKIDPYNCDTAVLLARGYGREFEQEQAEVRLRDEYTKFTSFIKNATTDEWNKLFVDPVLANLARQCLTIDPQTRPRATQLLSYTYLVGGIVEKAPSPCSPTPPSPDLRYLPDSPCQTSRTDGSGSGSFSLASSTSTSLVVSGPKEKEVPDAWCTPYNAIQEIQTNRPVSWRSGDTNVFLTYTPLLNKHLERCPSPLQRSSMVSVPSLEAVSEALESYGKKQHEERTTARINSQMRKAKEIDRKEGMLIHQRNLVTYSVLVCALKFFRKMMSKIPAFDSRFASSA